MSAASLLLQTAMAFNLICTGTSTSSRTGPTPMAEVFRVDLEAGRFCFDVCDHTLPIASVSATEIVFQNSNHEDGSVLIFRRVSRESGAYFGRVKFPFADITTEAYCDSAPFTGFPTRKF